MGPESHRILNHLLDIEEPLLLEGKSYTRKSLLEYCYKHAGNLSVPEWKREVLSFIALFIDPAGGAITQFSSGSTGDPK